MFILILSKVSTEKEDTRKSLRSSVSPAQSSFHLLVQSPVQSSAVSSCVDARNLFPKTSFIEFRDTIKSAKR